MTTTTTMQPTCKRLKLTPNNTVNSLRAMFAATAAAATAPVSVAPAPAAPVVVVPAPAPAYNNETIGISAELAMCSVFNIAFVGKQERTCAHFVKRCDAAIRDALLLARGPRIRVVQHLGSKNGFVDFLCDDQKTLSLKTNKQEGRVCAQKTGQMTLASWDAMFFPAFNGSNYALRQRVEFVLNNTAIYLQTQYDNMFCCDHLLHITHCDDDNEDAQARLYTKQDIPFANMQYSFSQEVPALFGIPDTTDNHTLAFAGFSTQIFGKLHVGGSLHVRIKLGELQMHSFTVDANNCTIKGRKCFKFRFETSFLKNFYH